MAGRERRRVHALSNTSGAGTTHTNVATVDETNAVNIHGVRISFVCEPEIMDANATGVWALWCLPRVTTAVPATTIANLEAEGDNPVLWMCGVWGGSNQTIYNLPITNPKTSRNCEAGTRVVLAVERGGVSSGNVRIKSIITYFTKSL